MSRNFNYDNFVLTIFTLKCKYGKNKIVVKCFLTCIGSNDIII